MVKVEIPGPPGLVNDSRENQTYNGFDWLMAPGQLLYCESHRVFSR